AARAAGANFDIASLLGRSVWWRRRDARALPISWERGGGCRAAPRHAQRDLQPQMDRSGGRSGREPVAGFAVWYGSGRTPRAGAAAALSSVGGWADMAVVLIVEDEDQVRVLAESILQNNGHRTLSAATKDEALALIQADGPIDLLFTDIGLTQDAEAGSAQAGLDLAREAI